MEGLEPTLYTHRIYISPDCKTVGQPQCRTNVALGDIVKNELQKLLNVDFIYPISDSQWVSPLVIVPKKGGKWRVCIDYRELNSATKKDHFPLPFVNKVLDNLVGNKCFSFFDGFNS